jgi:tRNA1(Val) A37 N6-methylase TrmN6
MDRHYTPAILAQEIVAQMQHEHPLYVADFAAGNGALLKAIRDRWPDAKLVATDIDGRAIRKLRKDFRKINAQHCDFLDSSARDASASLRALRGKVSLVFINPPFSCRGGRRELVELGGVHVSCSLAMSFVITSLRYLHANGQLVAILPASCLTSEKDASAIELLSKDYFIQEIGSLKPYAFKNCRVHITFVSIRRHSPQMVPFIPHRPANPLPLNNPSSPITIQLTRGRISMHDFSLEAGLSRVPLIHTTDLIGNKVHVSGRAVRTNRSIVRGPVILLPRVGRPDNAKLCLFEEEESIAISDCIIAVHAPSFRGTRDLYRALNSEWKTIVSEYTGSCAPYMTMSRLARAIQKTCANAFHVGLTCEIVNSRETRIIAAPEGAACAA